MDAKKMFELAKELQSLAHKYGYEDFRDATVQACYNASDELEDVNVRLSERYRDLATAINDHAVNEQEHDNE